MGRTDAARPMLTIFGREISGIRGAGGRFGVGVQFRIAIGLAEERFHPGFGQALCDGDFQEFRIGRRAQGVDAFFPFEHVIG